MSRSIDAAALCYGLYKYPDSPAIAWDYQDDGSGSEGVVWAGVRLNGLLWCVLRGSVTDKDWERDLYAVVDPFLHDDLGPIHPGFYKGWHRQAMIRGDHSVITIWGCTPGPWF